MFPNLSVISYELSLLSPVWISTGLTTYPLLLTKFSIPYSQFFLILPQPPGISRNFHHLLQSLSLLLTGSLPGLQYPRCINPDIGIRSVAFTSLAFCSSGRIRHQCSQQTSRSRVSSSSHSFFCSSLFFLADRSVDTEGFPLKWRVCLPKIFLCRSMTLVIPPKYVLCW